jgi:hypothetical protein
MPNKTLTKVRRAFDEIPMKVRQMSIVMLIRHQTDVTTPANGATSNNMLAVNMAVNNYGGVAM